MLVKIEDGHVVIKSFAADITTELTMSPTAARAMAADLLTAADTLDPSQVKIVRWLAEEDIEKYGDRWDWYYSVFGGHDPKPVRAKQIDGKIVIQIVGTTLWRDSNEYDECDYFTPIRKETT